MDSYPLAYRAYHNATDQQENNLACLQQQIPTALKKLRFDEDKATFNILSVGAGDGFMDQEILKIVQLRYLNVDKHSQEVKVLNTAVEPNAEFVGQYKEAIEKRDKRIESVEFNLKAMSFEEYVESKHESKQYNMVHAIHSLYHVDSIESTLKHCYYNELGETGLIACILGNDSDPPTVISRMIDKHRPGFQTLVTLNDNAAATFVRLAEKYLIRHEKVVIPFSIDVTSVFDRSSDEGSHLLDFLTHQENYRQTADQDEVTKVLKTIRDMATEDEHGRLILHPTNELILLYKTP